MAPWHFTSTLRRPWRQHAPAVVVRERKRRRWHSWLRIWLMAFGSLLAVRALLPFGVRWYVNGVLDQMEHYRGSIDRVRLNLWRGSYELDRLRLFKRGVAAPEPLVDMRRLDFSLQWQGLLHGRIVAEATSYHPVITFAKLREGRRGPERDGQRDEPGDQPGGEPRPPEQQQLGVGEPWALHLDKLTPFELNRFVIRDGEVRYRDETTDPPVDLYIDDFYLEALNIANVRGKPGEEVLLAEIEAAGRPFGTGELEARMRFDPLADPLRMELDLSARRVQLIDLNDFLRAYGRVDAESGTLGIYAEFATSDGVFKGYVKPLFENMRLLRFGEITGPEDALEALWEGLVSLASVVFENQPHARLATKIPLQGTTANASADIFAAIGNLLRNAFFVALGPAIDDSIDLRDMEIAVPHAGAPGKGVDPAAARATKAGRHGNGRRRQ